MSVAQITMAVAEPDCKHVADLAKAAYNQGARTDLEVMFFKGKTARDFEAIVLTLKELSTAFQKSILLLADEVKEVKVRLGKLEAQVEQLKVQQDSIDDLREMNKVLAGRCDALSARCGVIASK